MLNKGASIDVKDPMGPMAVHYAAAGSMDNFVEILRFGADVEGVDKIGRTALHWASVSGDVSVVNQIISASRGLVNQADNDGWTPLMWAARGCDTTLKKVSSSEQERLIKLLLHRGADPCVTVQEPDRLWSPVKVARYHGADTEVIKLLEDKAKDQLQDTGGVWGENLHASRQADGTKQWYCDCCFAVGRPRLFPAHHLC